MSSRRCNIRPGRDGELARLHALLAKRFRRRVDPAERRAFLQQSIAAAAALLLTERFAGADTSPGGTGGRRVVVIGAGLAGLACAHELHSSRTAEVTLLEARQRAGGRVLTERDFIEDANIEWGGELIGSNHPIWQAYAKQFGLTMRDVTEDEALHSPIELGGKVLAEEEANEIWEAMEALEEFLIDAARPIPRDAPWQAADADKLDARSVASFLDPAAAPPLVKRAFLAMLSADNAVSADRQSTLGLLAAIKGAGLDKYWSESEVFRCEQGNDALATKLRKALPEGMLRTGARVAAVIQEGGGVRVELADGLTVEADEAVLAVPPSVWGRIRFEPALPEGLAPQMGVALKHFSKVKSAFWEQDGRAPTAITDGLIGWTWDGTDNQPEAKEKCLTVFAGGDGAEAIRAKRGAERTEALADALERLHPGYGANLIAARTMDWPGDPMTAAGYSFPAPGEVTTVIRRLQQPFERLHFAGEHTSVQFAGYMEGALQSGAAVAARLGAPAMAGIARATEQESLIG